MKIKTCLPLLLLLLSSFVSFAQDWANKMQDPHANYYEIKSDFETYWSTRDVSEKGKGYKAFKRWENFVAPRVYPSGDLSLLNQTAANFQEFLKQQKATAGSGKLIGANTNLIASSTYTPMGPFGAISGSAGGQFLKAGRLCFITVDPTNTLNIWVGAPAGGLWKSTNGGTSWTTNTDNLPVIGCTDLAIDPTNTNIMYLATGDGDAGDTRSIGVLKSIDGGLTWNTTGLSNPVTVNFLIRRLLINPNNPLIVLAGTNTGIYRTSNGGTSWTQVSTANTYDMEFKPGDPTTVYSAGTNFKLSTDGGLTFTMVSTGITTSAGRMSIAVTAADANYVYVLASNGTTNGYLGLYQSTAAGSTFSLMSNSPNILDGTTTGSSTGGQGWYDLAIAASPLNRDELVIGGVNVWRSLNAGVNWALYGHWTGSGGAPFTHADQHDLEYANNGVLFNVNDGTVYKRAIGALNWTEISGTMNISQIYRMGLSSLTPNKWISGHQDNGTSIWNGTTYNAKIGGDGMDCFYDRTNDNNVFGEYQYGALQRSTNGGTNWSSATSGLSGTAPWLTVWRQDPVTASVLYCGYANLFKSTNLGASWTQLTALPLGGDVTEFAIAPSNNQIIYLVKAGGIFKTINGGTSWTNITGTVPVGVANPRYLAIDPNDPNNVWVVLSGYSAGNKVYVTSNGGTSWTNFSANLPNIPASCVVYQPGSNDRVYIGMDIGIYYRDNLSASWTLYNTGLPNVPVSELEITPASPTTLYASTYGRGVWAVDLVATNAVPLSNFSIPAAGKCVGAVVTFSDQSANGTTAWSWSVSPSAGVTLNSATSQNCSMNFLSSGIYTVSFQASNANGAGSVQSQTITINNPPVVSISGNTQTVCAGSALNLSASGASTYTWSNGGGTAATATFFPASAIVYSVTGTANGCNVTQTVVASVIPSPTLLISGPGTLCSGSSLVLTANGALSYTWSTGSNASTITVNPISTTSYSLSGTGPNGCKKTIFKTISVYALQPITLSPIDSIICKDEVFSVNAAGANSYTWSPGGQTGVSATFIADPTASYVCTGTDFNGCDNSVALTLTVSLCTDISKSIALDKDLFSVFPNPTKGKLTIKAESNSSAALNVTVLDVSGKVVFTQQLSFHGAEKALEINMTSLAAGLYFLKLSNSQSHSELLRIIKE